MSSTTNSLPAVALNVLDLAHRSAGGSTAEALHASVQLAKRAEVLGFERFWVAEHHGMPAITSSSPPVLIAAIAAQTERIRVGSGGVMLPNHPSLVVAEQFGTLRALYGDRIDLGIGRAPGTDHVTAAALRRGDPVAAADAFPYELGDLLGFFHGTLAPDNPLHGITAYPGLGDVPQIWLLGSSGYSAQLAAGLGLPFAFAHHFSSRNTIPAVNLYRERFTPSRWLDQPYVMVATAAIVEDDPQELRRQLLPGQLAFIRMRRGAKPEPVSLSEALAHEYTQAELDFIAARTERQAIGSAEQVRATLVELLEATGADELTFASSAATAAAREKTLGELAKMFA